MKRLIFTLTLFVALAAKSFAQATDVNDYAGGSGPGACNIPSLTAPGLAPLSDSLAPVIDGVPTSTVINFQNYDTVISGSITMDSLTIDSINNLPTGLTWKTSSATNTFGHKQNGCIIVTGTTNAAPGQYQLIIYVSAYTTISPAPNPLNTYASAVGLYYYVRVNASAAGATVPIDTFPNQHTLPKFEPYTAFPTAITPVNEDIQSISVYPNPFSNQTIVNVTSGKTGTMIEKITSVLGSEVYRGQFEVVGGNNSHTINRNNLASGIYFYTVSDGNSSVTKRIVIE